MSIDPFYVQQWDDLKRRVEQSGEYHGEHHPDIRDGIQKDVKDFCAQDPFANYKDMLLRYRIAGSMAVAWMQDQTAAEWGDKLQEVRT